MVPDDHGIGTDIIGLRLSFPKFVSFSTNNYAKMEDTRTFSTKALYDTLADRIKKNNPKGKVSDAGYNLQT